MARRIWYNITLLDRTTGERKILAKVRSRGLANIVYQELKNTYKNIDHVLIELEN